MCESSTTLMMAAPKEAGTSVATNCWIIYTKSDGNERLTVTETRRQLSPEIGDSGNHETEDNDDGTDQSLHEILDLELRPEPPIGNNAQSQEIYEEHRRLAKEFLRVDTKLYYAQDLKDKLLSQMDPAEREQKQEILKKMNEKKELLELYKNLKQQLEKMRSTAGNQQSNPPSSSFGGANAANSEPVADDGADVLPANDLVSDDDWVLIAPHNNNNNNNNNSSSNNNT